MTVTSAQLVLIRRRNEAMRPKLIRVAHAATAQAGEKNARLTATPDFAPGVNPAEEMARGKVAVDSLTSEKQVVAPQEVAKESETSAKIGTFAPDGGAGYQELENSVNRSEVVVSEELTSELRSLLAELGVNQAGAVPGRKHVFDEFLQGRLVSLLAMGFTLRQAGAALGVSHVAVWKELRRNPDLYDDINSARFQAQVEPLLVILRESRRSWRAATWLVNYLSKKIGEREETPEEAESRQQQEIDDARRARQERAAEEQARQGRPGRETCPQTGSQSRPVRRRLRGG